MNLKNRVLRRLAEKEYIAWKPDYYTEDEKKYLEWKADQLEKLQNGEDIDPPWLVYPKSDPVVLWVSWRYGNFWLDEIWKPFWNKLSVFEKKAYLERWQPLSEEWYENVTVYWNDGMRERAEWFQKQLEDIRTEQEIKPPWVEFPLLSPDFGWSSGYGEQWKLQIWLPFWRKLNESEQTTYLQRFPPPNQEWIDLITVEWAGKLKKADYWFENQRRNTAYYCNADLPWAAFPMLPPAYEWDTADIEKWLREIWLPFWNEASAEKRDKYLEYASAPDAKWLQILWQFEIKDFAKIERLVEKFVSKGEV